MRTLYDSLGPLRERERERERRKERNGEIIAGRGERETEKVLGTD